MFDTLSERLSGAMQRLRGQARITEENIRDALRDVRIALLEADVALPVVQQFVAGVREKALGQDVVAGLTGGQAFIRVVHDELVRVLGEESEGLDLKASPPVVVLMAGLQGAGKTTTVAKLAQLLRERHEKKVMVASVDVHRPAAIDQLETLAGQCGATFFPSSPSQRPEDIARAAVDAARKAFADVLIVDSAGRLAIDEAMMDEIRRVHAAISPHETLFVVDSMTGQDAATTARAFADALELTGVVLTKTDGDARGGAALSVKTITGKPIKFIGVSEKIDGLEPFYPDRIAQRILGMGDVLSLVEEVQRKVDQEKAAKLARKVRKGRKFDLEDMRDQLLEMKKLGGLTSMLDKLPGMGQLPDQVRQRMDDSELTRMVAIINSMTVQERRFPDLMSRGSRKRRVALGSGSQVQDINRLLKQYGQMERMMKKMGKGGPKALMKKLKGRMPPGGGLPPGGGGLPPFG